VLTDMTPTVRLFGAGMKLRNDLREETPRCRGSGRLAPPPVRQKDPLSLDHGRFIHLEKDVDFQKIDQYGRWSVETLLARKLRPFCGLARLDRFQ
jgi:hypothetical protein